MASRQKDPGVANHSVGAGVTGDLPFANLTPATAASKLLGRGDSGAGDFQEISLGSGLSMTGTTLAASGGSAHDLLDGSQNQDTVAQSVSRGSLVYGNSTPKWDELTVGSAGSVLTSDGTDVSWSPIGLDWTALVTKGSDQTVTNSATLTDDNSLQYAVFSGSIYFVEYFITYQGTDTGADYKWAFTFPAAAAADSMGYHLGITTANAFDGANFGTISGSIGFWTVSSGHAQGVRVANTNLSHWGRFTFVCNANGTLKYQFCQNVQTGSQSVTTKSVSFFRVKVLI